MFTFENPLVRLSSEIWACGVFVPVDISKALIAEDHKRVVCTLNQKETYQCALMPNGDNQYFINVNKAIQKKLKVEVGDSLLVNLVPDESEYGLPVPEEFAELLRQDSEGNQLFHELTAGKQRSLLHIAGSPKSSETRLIKSIVIIEHLKDQQGRLDFKLLNVAFKLANDRS